MPEYTYQDAKARIDEAPELDVHSDTILYDWPEGDEHWAWVCTAPVAEIVDWAETVEAQGEVTPAVRDVKLTILVTEEERRRYHTAAAMKGTTLSDVVRDHLDDWSARVLVRQL